MLVSEVHMIEGVYRGSFAKGGTRPRLSSRGPDTASLWIELTKASTPVNQLGTGPRVPRAV